MPGIFDILLFIDCLAMILANAFLLARFPRRIAKINRIFDEVRNFRNIRLINRAMVGLGTVICFYFFTDRRVCLPGSAFSFMVKPVWKNPGREKSVPQLHFYQRSPVRSV